MYSTKRADVVKCYVCTEGWTGVTLNASAIVMTWPLSWPGHKLTCGMKCFAGASCLHILILIHFSDSHTNFRFCLVVLSAGNHCK